MRSGKCFLNLLVSFHDCLVWTWENSDWKSPKILLVRTVQLVLDQQHVKTKMENHYFQRRLFYKINFKCSKIISTNKVWNVSAGWTLGLIQSGFIFMFFVLIYPDKGQGAELKYLFSSDWMKSHVSHVGPETFNQSSNQAVEPQLRRCEGSSFNLRPSPWTRWDVEIMTLQLRTKPGLWDLHCSVGLTDWDMDKELKLATTSDQFLHGDSSPPPPCQS